MKIELKGHLDTSKVHSVRKEIDAKLSMADTTEPIVIDCSELSFISSSGLRVLLNIRKTFPQTKVVNVNSEVYDVFEMTGFTRILDVEKALRKICLQDCILIGEGGNGAVYKINDEEIVKVSKFAKGDDALVHESELVREAFLMGVPTVICFDTVDCGNGLKGVVMEALDSQSLGSFISEDSSRMDIVVPQYVELFRQTNSIHTDSSLFRNTKEWLRSHLALPQRIINDEEADLLSCLLDEVPDSNHFVHFDGHVGNVLMYGEKNNRNLMLIDMGDAGIGHPVFEIAGMGFLMLEPDDACTMSEAVTGMSRELNKVFSRRALSLMFNVSNPAELDNLVRQATLVSYLKSAFYAQRWASLVTDERIRSYIVRCVHDAIKQLPEIKAAIRFFVNAMER